MFIELSSIPFGEETLFEGVIADQELLSDKLGVKPLGAFAYKLKASKRDDDLIVSLSVEGKVSACCDLCGEETVAPCKGEIEEVFTTNDQEYDFAKKGYDLQKFLEDCIALSTPRTVRCKADCKGLCLRCGANLNKETCKCTQTLVGDNNPFGVLQDILLTEGAKNGSTKK